MDPRRQRLLQAVDQNDLALVQKLHAEGVDVHTYDDEAFRLACWKSSEIRESYVRNKLATGSHEPLSRAQTFRKL